MDHVYDMSPIIIKLLGYIEKIPGWYLRFTDAIDITIQYNLSEFVSISNLYDWLQWCNELLFWIPTGENLDDKITAFYFVLNQPSVKELQINIKEPSKLTLLSEWMVEYAQELGKFLDSTESLTSESLQTFYEMPEFHMDEYAQDPSGWKTFNQFFARRIKPGYRQISYPDDNRVIVSVADSNFRGVWKIDEKVQITVKNIKWSIYELLEDNPFADYFKNGTFMHAYLSPTDYHRFHTPLSGIVLHASIIKGQVSGESAIVPIKNTNKFKFETERTEIIDPVGFQFYQARGLLILNTIHGLVAILPIGMSLVSSVVITAEQNTHLYKGEEFGYFQCGGSDYILLFQEGMNINITDKIGTHYNQGNVVGYIL